MSRNRPLLVVLSVSLFSLFPVLLAHFFHDVSQIRWQHAARWTADWSALLFLSIFVPQASRILPGIARRDRVLAFLAAHLIHAATFIIYHLTSEAPQPAVIMLGGLGYLIMGAMVSIPPKSAPRLHLVGIWYLWLVFIATFAIGFGDESRLITSAIGVSIFAIAALARLFRKLRGRAA